MCLSYFSAVSLLAVIFSTLSYIDCASPKLGKRCHEAGQDGPHSSSDEEPKLKKLSYTKYIDQGIERMLGNPDVMEADDARAPVIERPEVLGMDRETFNKLNMETKIKLTEGLSAKEWNRILDNFWAEGKDNIHILYYTLKYDEERRLTMLEKPSQRTFSTCLWECLIWHVPRTPRVIRLLERRLEVYPHLRHWVLSTIYQLERPTTKWHLSNAEENMDLLNYLIAKGLIKREAIAGHLAEIVTQYQLEILESLLFKELINVQDVCSKELYAKVWALNGKDYLKWAKEKCGLESGQEHLDTAVSQGHEPPVDFIAEELGTTVLPSQKAVNEAASNGMLTLLVNKCSVWGLFPNTDGVNGAAIKGQLSVLKWLGTLGIYPNQRGANLTVKNGRLEMLEWLAKLKPDKRKIYPD